MSLSKRFLVVAVIAALISGILYVGRINNRLEEENKENAYYKTHTLYFWYSDECYTDFLTNAAVEYHAENPDTRVIPVLVSSSEYLQAINDASLSGDNFPDLYILSNESLEKAYLAGLACKVKDSSGILNESCYPKAAIDAVTYHTNHIAYPLSFETTALMYNKTYLQDWVDRINSGEETAKGEGVSLEEMDLTDEDAENFEGAEGDGEQEEESSEPLTLDSVIPKSFDDLYYFSDKYETKEKVKTLVKWDVSDVLYNYLFIGAYMDVGGDTGDDPTKISFNNENTLECMKAYKGLNEIFSIDSDTDYETTLNDFLEGDSLFTIVSSDAIAKSRNLNADKEAKLRELNGAVVDEKEKASKSADAEGKEEALQEKLDSLQKEIDAIDIYEYGFARVPYVKEALKSRALSVTDAIVINGYSTNKTDADKFAAFISQECAPSIYQRTGRLAASRKAGYEEGSPESLFQEEYDDSIPLSKLVEASNLWVQLEITLKEIWNGADASESLNALNQQIMSQLGTE
ncbi:MAG: extracellular solute-binding protein [Lachnospiraceae bacterium]|nr:extracellular solute-binding protein [Lachnospiraceae bacterium]